MIPPEAGPEIDQGADREFTRAKYFIRYVTTVQTKVQLCCFILNFLSLSYVRMTKVDVSICFIFKHGIQSNGQENQILLYYEISN